MRQDSAFSISNCNAHGCSNPYNHLSASSIRPPSILLRYRNTPSSTPQRSFPSVPQGVVKLETIWDGNRLITGEIYGATGRFRHGAK